MRQCAKPALAPLPANKNDIVEWRELVYGRDGIVGDIIAQESLIEVSTIDIGNPCWKCFPRMETLDLQGL